MLLKVGILKASSLKKLFKVHIEAMSGNKPLRIYVYHSHNLIKNLKFLLKSPAVSCWNVPDNIVENLLIRQFFSQNDVINWQFAFQQ